MNNELPNIDNCLLFIDNWVDEVWKEGFFKVSVKSYEFFWSCINFFFCIYRGVAKRNWSESKDSIRAPYQNWRAFEAPAGGWVSRLEFLFGSDKVQSNRNSKSELPCNSLLARVLVSCQNGNALFSRQSAVISYQLSIISLRAYLSGFLK